LFIATRVQNIDSWPGIARYWGEGGRLRQARGRKGVYGETHLAQGGGFSSKGDNFGWKRLTVLYGTGKYYNRNKLGV
jgi:hypothetical protein